MSDLPPLPNGLEAVRATPISGGDVAAVWQAQLADGREVVVKATPYDAALEAEGLRALRDAGGPIPAVVAVGPRTLVLEHVVGPAAWEQLGTQLAEVHSHHGRAFGWHRDNVIGPLPQRNTWTARSGAFVVEQRLRPHLEVLPGPVRTRVEAACAGPLPELLDGHDPPPSLVHGDLWTGNIVAGRWLIDPAVHHADRETDLAMLMLFGSPAPSFWEAYLERAPLPAGWRRRRPALQLAPLLVHVRLFGPGYVPAVVRALDEAEL